MWCLFPAQGRQFQRTTVEDEQFRHHEIDSGAGVRLRRPRDRGHAERQVSVDELVGGYDLDQAQSGNRSKLTDFREAAILPFSWR